MNNYINIPKNIINWEYYKDSQAVHLYLHLLIKSSPEEIYQNGIKINKGELITSAKQLADELNLNKRQITIAFSKLLKSSLVSISKIDKYLIIKVNNYKSEEEEEEDYIAEILIKSYGRLPTIPEREFIESLVRDFGKEKTLKIMKEAKLRNFKNFYTLRKALDKYGNIKEREQDGIYKKYITEDKLRKIAEDIATDKDLE